MTRAWVFRLGLPVFALAVSLPASALQSAPSGDAATSPPPAPPEEGTPPPTGSFPAPQPAPAPDAPYSPLPPTPAPTPEAPPVPGPAVEAYPDTSQPAPALPLSTTQPKEPDALPSQWALESLADYDRRRFDTHDGRAARYDEPKKKDPSDGLFGPFRIGVLVGGGLPNLMSFGVTTKITRFFGAGVNVGLIPTVKLSIYGKARISYQEYDAYARVFPFGGGFFLGSGIGYQHAKGTFTYSQDSGVPQGLPSIPDDIPESFTTETSGSVRALIITPQLGYFQIFGPGFCVGVDVGAQIPIAPGEIRVSSKSSDLDALPPRTREVVNQYFSPGSDEVRDTLDTIARVPIPSFSIRIGWVL